jgi:SAM-dependent methyltransferase
LFGTVAVQLGRIGRLDMLDTSVAPTRVVLDILAEAGGEGLPVRGLPEQLPFLAGSVDVVLLPHTLDFASDPHHVLREVERVLAPEGHAVVLGFNPLSLWGIRRLFARRRRAVPWSGHFFRLARIKDWLALLNFECVQGRMLYYRPPLAHEGVMDRLHFLDKMGDRWWPLAAAVYLLVAKKRMFGVTPLPLEWKTTGLAGRGLAAARPSTRGLAVAACGQRRRVG